MKFKKRNNKFNKKKIVYACPRCLFVNEDKITKCPICWTQDNHIFKMLKPITKSYLLFLKRIKLKEEGWIN